MQTAQGGLKRFATGKSFMERFQGDASPMSPPVIQEEGGQQVSFMTSAADKTVDFQANQLPENG